MKIATKLGFALGVCVVLSPLGLILPQHFKAGGAWGEWSAAEMEKLVGYVPQGLKQLSVFWKAPMHNYVFKGWAEKGPTHTSLAYLLSAIVGAVIVALAIWLLGKILVGRHGVSARRDAVPAYTFARAHVVPSRTGFIERSMGSALAFFRQSLFADETASLPGLLQALDPRVKAVTLLAFLLLILFTHRLPILALLYLLCLLAAFCREFIWGPSLADLGFYSFVFAADRRTGFVQFSFSPGKSILSFGVLSITRQGILAAAFFIGRVITSVSLTVLLSMTTRHFELLKALRAFGVPQVFVMVLGISYRYIIYSWKLSKNTYRAIKSRVGFALHYRKGQRLVTWNMAHLWKRSYQLNEQVYQAMLSRGFRGEPVILDHFRFRTRDWMWLGGCAATILMLVCAELMIRI